MPSEFTLVCQPEIPNFMQSLTNYEDRGEVVIGHLHGFNPDKLMARIREVFVEAVAAGVKPRNFRARALFFDMDSTVIGQETIVELARAAGLKEEVEAITNQAMEGKLDFAESLRRRVRVLAGLPTSILADTQPRLIIEPGIKELVRFASDHNVPSFLISGGFVEMAEPIVNEVGFAGFHANRLEAKGGKLTGEVLGPIVDAKCKADWLVDTCKRHSIEPKDAVAVGDGANDLLMMEAAGLAVGYNPKNVLLPVLHAVNRSGSHRFLQHFLFV